MVIPKHNFIYKESFLVDMEALTIPKVKFDKILTDIDILISDIEEVSQDEIVQQRIADVEADPSLGKSEQELDDYLKKRGVRVNGVGY